LGEKGEEGVFAGGRDYVKAFGNNYQGGEISVLKDMTADICVFAISF
jgi:hypothetical protein